MLIIEFDDIKYRSPLEITYYTLGQSVNNVIIQSNTLVPNSIKIPISDIVTIDDLENEIKFTEATFYDWLNTNLWVGEGGIPLPAGAEIIVTQGSDIFNKSLDPTKVYRLANKIIPTATDSIWVGEGGLSINGYGERISSFIGTESNTDLFIKDPSASYTGAVIIKNLSITLSGANSQVFALDNDEQIDNENNQIEFDTVSFVSCTNVGYLRNYRQGFWNVGSFIFSGALSLGGTWSGGFKIVENRTINGNADAQIKAEVGLSLGGRFFTNMFYTATDSGASVCDFSPSNIVNDVDFQIIGAEFDGAVSEISDHFPNMPIESTKAFYDSFGIEKTNVGARTSYITEATTIISSTGVWVDASGTTEILNAQWFTQPSNGEQLYGCNQNISGRVEGSIIIDGGFGDFVGARIVQTRGETDTIVAESRGEIALGGTIPMVLLGFAEIKDGDSFKLQVRNEDDTTDIIVKLLSQFIISKR